MRRQKILECKVIKSTLLVGNRHIDFLRIAIVTYANGPKPQNQKNTHVLTMGRFTLCNIHNGNVTKVD